MITVFNMGPERGTEVGDGKWDGLKVGKLSQGGHEVGNFYKIPYLS